MNSHMLHENANENTKFLPKPRDIFPCGGTSEVH